MRYSYMKSLLDEIFLAEVHLSVDTKKNYFSLLKTDQKHPMFLNFWNQSLWLESRKRPKSFKFLNMDQSNFEWHIDYDIIVGVGLFWV